MKEINFSDIEAYCADIEKKILRGECSNMNKEDPILLEMKEMIDKYAKVELIIWKKGREMMFSEAVMESVKAHGMVKPLEIAKAYNEKLTDAVCFMLRL